MIKFQKLKFSPSKKRSSRSLKLAQKSWRNAYSVVININLEAIPYLVHWQNQWKNLHLIYKSIFAKKFFLELFSRRKQILNNFYYHKYHKGLRLVGNTFSFFDSKAPKIFRKFRQDGGYLYKNTGLSAFFEKPSLPMVWNHEKLIYEKKKRVYYSFLKKRRKFRNPHKLVKTFFGPRQNRWKVQDLSRSILEYTKTQQISVCFTHYFFPKTYIVGKANLSFKRYRTLINFWEGLQLFRLVVENKTTSQMLAKFLAKSIRRNPKRVAFIIYFKRLIDWHFSASENLGIQGIRVEVKGRFNAKSRARKYILSVGRVAKEEKTSKVDYSFLEAFSIFGSLGIKVWICPLLFKNVTSTT